MSEKRKNIINFQSLAATLSCMVASLYSANAYSAALEEVIVTAQKRTQSVNDVPITISAFSGEKLKELGVVDTRDLGKLVPGFKYSATGLNKPVFTLRGVGYNDFSQTASGTVGIYLGEFNLPYPVMAKGPSLDIERIEVLKGPQGTLYGRNTTAGVVNFIPTEPREEFEAGITATYGRFKTFDTEAYISGRVTETINMRLAARKIESGEGWQYSLTRPNEELGKQDKWSARYTIAWLPSETLSFSLGLDHWEDQGEPQAAQPIAIEGVNPFVGSVALDDSVRNHPLVPMNTNDSRVADWPSASRGLSWKLDDAFSMARLRMDWDFIPDATISYLLSYADFQSDKDALPSSGLSVYNAEGLVDVDTTAWTHELRISGSYNDKLDYIVGAFVSEDDVEQYWSGRVNTLSSFFPVGGENQVADRLYSKAKQHSEIEAIFFDVTWDFSSTFSTTVGARYTEEQRDFEGCSGDDPDANGLVTFAALMNILSVTRGGSGGAGRGDCTTLDHDTGNPGLVTKELEEDNLSGRFVLDWTPVDGWLFYLSRSRGFKSGSFPIGQTSDSNQYNPSVQEQLDAWELGGKLSLFDYSVQLNFAVFDYDYRDKQLLSYVPDPVFGALQQLANAPRSQVQGAEFDLRSRLTERFDVYAAASYIDTEITDFIGYNQSGQQEDFSGRKFNNAPDLTGSAGFRYVWNIPKIESFDVSFGADYSYTGKTSSALNDDPRYRVDEYHNINARISLVSISGDWTVTVWGRNVTNEYQPVSVGATVTDAIQRYVQMPRTYGITLQYKFGAE